MSIYLCQILKQRLCITPSAALQCHRNYAKPNVQRPQFPHRDRANFLEITKVKLPPVIRICPQAFNAKAPPKPVEPLAQLFASEFLQKLDKSKLILTFIKLPSLPLVYYDARVELSAANVFELFHDLPILKLALKGTNYDALIDLYDFNTVTFVSDEATNLAKALKILRKAPTLILLAGVVEGRFMSVSDLKDFASLPPLPNLYGELVSVLSSPAQKINSNLSHHQTDLSSALSRYSTPEGDGGDNTPSTESKIDAKSEP